MLLVCNYTIRGHGGGYERVPEGRRRNNHNISNNAYYYYYHYKYIQYKQLYVCVYVFIYDI